MIHIVKGFSEVSKADVFLEFPSFLYDPVNVGNLVSGSSAFSKPSLYIWKFSVHVLLKTSLKDVEYYVATLLACKMSATVQYSECNWTFFALPFFGIGIKTDLFQSCGHWVFQICCYIEYSTLTAASFRMWNSSAGIPSLPLALLVVMLPKAHLTSHSRMSGSRSVITPLWLSGSWRFFFLYSSSVYSCHLF